jgi:hypothetical protein
MQKVATPVQSTVANHEQHNQENVERWKAGEKNCAMHIQEKRRPRQEMQSRLLKKKTRAEPGECSPIQGVNIKGRQCKTKRIKREGRVQNLVKPRPSTWMTIQV